MTWGVDLGDEELCNERDSIVDCDLFRSPHVVELKELDVSASADDGDRCSASRARAIDLRVVFSRSNRSNGSTITLSSTISSTMM